MFLESDSHVLRFLEAFGYTEENNRVAVKTRNYCALSYRIKAERTVLVCGKKQLALQSGDILFCPFHAEYTRRTDHDSVMVVHFEVFDGSFADFEKFTPREPEKYARYFAELLDCYNGGAPERLHLCASMLYRILGEIRRELDDSRLLTERARKLQPAMELLRLSFCEPSLSVAALAGKCGMSEVYFRRLFEEETGFSPRRYITELRIGKAIAMLRSPYYTLSEIAEAVGFCDAKYFSTVFRRVVGTTPAKFSISPCTMSTRWK